jgi:hypothetical protein
MLGQLKDEVTALANEVHLRIGKLRKDKHYLASALRKLKHISGDKWPHVLKELNLSAKRASELMQGDHNNFNRQSAC